MLTHRTIGYKGKDCSLQSVGQFFIYGLIIRLERGEPHMNKIDVNKVVGQLLVVGFEGKKITSEIKELIHTFHVGGIILFSRNIGTPSEILNLTTDLQREAKMAGYQYPLLICVDQENGIVRRLGAGTTVFPGAMALGATDDVSNAYNVGYATGEELLGLGINWNLAPVVDVNNNPENPVIGVRSFGQSPAKVAQFGKESMKGMQDAGVVTTLKHFPGHGDTDVDSHLTLPTISHDLQRLEEVELTPFKACIAAGADTVMTAHIHFPAIESEAGLPATLSEKVITGLLRQRLHYNGVVTTDCMEMDAISQTIGTEKGAVSAVKAGADFVMISHTFERQKGSIKEIVNALESGEIDMNEILEANKRIQDLKEKYLDWDNVPFDDVAVPENVGSNEHKELATEVYQNSTTIVENNGLLPLNKNNKVLVIYPESSARVRVEDENNTQLSLGAVVQKYHPSARIEQLNDVLSGDDMEGMVREAKQYDAVIVGTTSISSESNQLQLIKKLKEMGIPVVVVAMRTPYALSYFPDIPAYVCTYEFTPTALEVAGGVIFGDKEAKGKLPITIPDQ